jgi:hypothetical protein
MKKFSITVGETVKGDLIVLNGPNETANEQRIAVRELSANGGSLGGKKPAIKEAVIIHSVRGIVKKQKMNPKAEVAPKAKDE